MLQARDSLQHNAEDEVKLLLHELALQSPTSLLGLLHSHPSFQTLYDRWETLPVTMAGWRALEHSSKQQKQIQAGPCLMQLPHLFQVIQCKWVDLCCIKPGLACCHEVSMQPVKILEHVLSQLSDM